MPISDTVKKRTARLFSTLALILAISSFSIFANAATLTEVLDAADGERDPIDFSIILDFSHEIEWSMLTRERNNLKSTEKLMLNQNEFVLKTEKFQLDINGKIGLYHDLELHFTLPIVISQTYNGKQSGHWREYFWSGAYDPSLSAQKRRPTLMSDRVFGYASWETLHRGFGDMILGFSYSPVNSDRDPIYPDFVMTLDMQLPTGPEQSPKMEEAASAATRGTGDGINVGEKVFAFIFKLAISKRMGVTDPYFSLAYKLPIAVGGLIKDPRHEGEFILGTEFVAYEKKPEDSNEPLWKAAFDMRFEATLFGRGHAFNEITDPLAWRKNETNVGGKTFWPTDPRVDPSDASDPSNIYYNYPGGQAPDYELPIEDGYLQIRGTLGFYAIIYHYLLLKFNFSAGHRTEHFLSLPEKLDERTLRPIMVDSQSSYNAQINEIGARVKKEQSFVFDYMITLGFNY